MIIGIIWEVPLIRRPFRGVIRLLKRGRSLNSELNSLLEKAVGFPS